LENPEGARLRTVDQIDPKEMILPLVVTDVHEEAAKNPDSSCFWTLPAEILVPG